MSFGSFPRKKAYTAARILFMRIQKWIEETVISG